MVTEMLHPDYFEHKADRMIQLYQQLEDFILSDIARRLLKAGDITSTAERLLYKLKQAGESRAAVERKLMELTKMSRQELRKVLQDSVLTSWEDDSEVFEEMGVTDLKPPLENPAVVQLMDAQYKKSLGELSNLTRTTMDEAQRNLIQLMDAAEMRVSSGAQSYTQAICDVLDQYAGKGVMVNYPTGTKRTLEAAVRCCVVTSMNQTAAQITLEYAKQAEAKLVLVSAHPGARYTKIEEPANHLSWQGRVFSIKPEDLEKLTNV